MKPFTYAMQATFAALGLIVARLFMFDAQRCHYCGARTANAHHESCPAKDRLGQGGRG